MTLTPELFQIMIDDIYNGLSLSKSLEKHGVNRSSFYTLLKQDLKCADQYACARQAQADLYVEQLIPISDDPSIDPNRARNMIQTRQWSASKLRPSTYGDKLDVNVTATASITDALLAARARALPMCDLDNTLDVEATVIPTIDGDSVTGCEPVNADDDENAESSDDILS